MTNGNIDAGMSLPLNERIDLATVNGNVNLTIPTSTSAQFSASVTFGTVRVSNLNLKGGTSTTQAKSGTLGDGEGTIALRSSIGDITVTGQQ